MAMAQFIQEGMQFAGGLFDSAAGGADAQASKTQGYRTADVNEERIRARSAQQLGEQRAAAAQSGFDPNSGSFATLQAQSAGNAELDALTERYKGQINAWQQDLTIQRGKDKMGYLLDPVFHNSKAGSLLFGGGVSYFAGSSLPGANSARRVGGL